MNTSLIAVVAIALCFRVPATAHRLDEYLQATMLSVEKDRIRASMRLIPGVAVASAVIDDIDTDRNGLISEIERHAYAERVVHDLSFSVNGLRFKPQVLSVEVPEIGSMREGLGEIKIEFAVMPIVSGSERKIVLENRHRKPISVYLVNCLTTPDRGIQIVQQTRNADQSLYELDYVQSSGSSGARVWQWWQNLHALTDGAGGFPSMFRLGMRHIAEGTDHLLFLLALLLPAPLLAMGSHWRGFGSVGQSALRIVRVVTAFTVGHSITLALAAFGMVRVPARPIELLIAVSILVSAVHALRPLFPRSEARIAAFFGLMHGLAFAVTLQTLGLGWGERVVSILGFNLGIEAMQAIVVCAVMPSLVLLSRTRVYPLFRIGGALFSILASMGWIAERLLKVHNPVDALVNCIADRALWIAPELGLISLACWLFQQSGLKSQKTAIST